MPTGRLRTLYSILLVLLDTVGILLAYFAAFFFRTWIPIPEEIVDQIVFSDYRWLMGIHLGCVLLILFINRRYYITRAPSRVGSFYKVVVSSSIGTVLGIAVGTFVFKGQSFIQDYPRMMTVYALLLTIIFLAIGRIIHQSIIDWLRSRGIGRDRLLVVGTGEVARLTLQRIQWSPRLGYEVVGVVDPENGMRRLLGVPVLGTPEDLPELVERQDIDEVIIAIPELGHRETVKIVSYCQRGRVSIKIFPDVFQFITSEATIDDLGGLPLLTVRDFAMRGYFLLGKRIVDIIGSGVGLVLLSPMLLMVALAVKLESRGPAFFVQERMGLDGKPFKILKFRSMRSDAEEQGPGWTVENDPRRTKIGSLIRRTNLDEFPQLVNVLLGEMSLVGPRPEQPYYVKQFRKTVPDYMSRHQLRAGMTGWAQVNGLRGDTSIVERTKYDLYYIENWSLLLDITIIVRTLWQMVIGGNAGAG